MSKPKDKYICSMALAMDIIQGKWKTIILWHLRKKPKRFGKLQKEIPNIAQKILTEQLRELENSGLVARKVYPQIPPKVEYSLTSYGKELIPILYSIFRWGLGYAKSFNLPLSTSDEVIKKILCEEEKFTKEKDCI